MRSLIAAALALVVALPVSAASDKSAKSKSRTLKSLIELALSDGKSVDCDPDTVKELGFDSTAITDGVIKTKAISYKQTVTPDKQKHIFSVVYKPGVDGSADAPLSLMWASFATRHEGDKILAEGRIFRATLSGKLESAVSISGVVGEVTNQTLSPDSPEIKKAFLHEIEFYRKISIGLPLTTK